MSHESRPPSPVFHFDFTTDDTSRDPSDMDPGAEALALLRDIASTQQRQTELLEELVQNMGAAQKQRTAELGQWKKAHPQLAQRCRQAAEKLTKAQVEFLHNLTDEISENHEALLDGEFMLNEFVDRFGPRMAHLNGVLQILSQLSSQANAKDSPTPGE